MIFKLLKEIHKELKTFNTINGVSLEYLSEADRRNKLLPDIFKQELKKLQNWIDDHFDRLKWNFYESNRWYKLMCEKEEKRKGEEAKNDEYAALWATDYIIQICKLIAKYNRCTKEKAQDLFEASLSFPLLQQKILDMTRYLQEMSLTGRFPAWNIPYDVVLCEELREKVGAGTAGAGPEREKAGEVATNQQTKGGEV